MKSDIAPARRTIRKGLSNYAPLIALAFVALGAWLAGSSAAPPAAPPKDAATVALWAQLDANGDGRISAAEGAASAEFTSSFEMMDVDSDGFVSTSEYRRHPSSAHKPRDQQRQQRRNDMGEEEEERRRR